jgi:hypothetical protein
MQIQGRSFTTFTLGDKSFNTLGMFAKAEVWPSLVRFQFVQLDDLTIEVRGVCNGEAKDVLPGLCDLLHKYYSEKGCPEARFTWSDKPLIPNKNGGKIPIYIKL